MQGYRGALHRKAEILATLEPGMRSQADDGHSSRRFIFDLMAVIIDGLLRLNLKLHKHLALIYMYTVKDRIER